MNQLQLSSIATPISDTSLERFFYINLCFVTPHNIVLLLQIGSIADLEQRKYVVVRSFLQHGGNL
ncbi:hypothetical protein ACFSSA_14960 [Luteolibacter algae]|uniref:Uncharacterized protein n=1 Tax=Luteolibacter algae TaxID=454151 RepID=A0ABW5DBQ4_9BACT